MPFITLECGQLTNQQKESLCQRITEISSELMNIPQEFFIMTIKELPDENIAIAGKSLAKVKKEYLEKHN